MTAKRMYDFSNLETLSKATEAILHPPFEWCLVKGGLVTLEDASQHGGTQGGIYQVTDFAIAKYPLTNAQYDKFILTPNGYFNPKWWKYSSEASQWLVDHPNPRPTAFKGADLPVTRVSWFDSMAFCLWLSTELGKLVSKQQKVPLDPHAAAAWPIRLPSEQEWQRAALGDTGWQYPWGDNLDEARGNYGGHIGQPTSVGKYPGGKSPYDALDMIGNVWEWCLTGWGEEEVNAAGYTYRVIRGGAWNITNPDYLRANDRGCHPPRGRLNDCGFRCGCFFL